MLEEKFPQIISPFLFIQYSMCPAWAWHDIYTDSKLKKELPEFATKLMEQGVLHEADYIKDLEVEEVKEIDPKKAKEITLGLMEQGVKVIYQGLIEVKIGDDIWRGRPDLLERRPGKSNFGNWLYVPVDIKSSTKIKTDHEYQLAFYARVLQEVQGVLPNQSAIINKTKERINFDINDAVISKMIVRVNLILDILHGKKPSLHLRGNCKQTPWGHMCLKDCEDKNDVALIYNVRDVTLDKLREAGIETITELAKLDISSPQFKIVPNTWKRIILQAQALVEDKLIWLCKPDHIPTADYKIYFDIEGDPLLGLEYMFGFWLGNEAKFKYFLAEKPDEEETMWNEFLVWLKELPKEYMVYHYANYEKVVLEKMEKKYGGSKELDIFKERLVDLFKIVKETVIFPLYFYSVKDLAKSRFVNYKWRHQKAGGAQSIFWYEKWLETGDRKVLQDIIDYNEDDVVATEYLYKWLVKYQ